MSAMIEISWVTDRLPTIDDASYDDTVWITDSDGTLRHALYYHVVIGTPWMKEFIPEPYVNHRPN